MWAGGDALMMALGLGVTLAMIARPGSTMIIGARLEAVRRHTLAERLALVGGAGSFSEGADVDEDEGALTAYNQMLARMNGGGSTPPERGR